MLPEPDTWKLSRVKASLAAARAPEERQTGAVWKALQEAGLPRKVHTVVRSILWKKLPLGERMHRMQMADTDLCPLCQRKEDHEHRVKRCPYLDLPIQVIRDLYKPVKMATGGRYEPSRLCLDHPELSLKWEQGIFMWSAVAALWRYRCEVRYERTEPTKEGFAAFWMAELGHWGRGEPVAVSPRSAQRVRQAIRLWLVHRAKPVQVADPGLPPKQDKKKGQQERKEQHKQRVLEEHRLGEDPPPRECRGYGRMGPSRKGWTADSMQGMESGLGNDTP